MRGARDRGDQVPQGSDPKRSIMHGVRSWLAVGSGCRWLLRWQCELLPCGGLRMRTTRSAIEHPEGKMTGHRARPQFTATVSPLTVASTCTTSHVVECSLRLQEACGDKTLHHAVARTGQRRAESRLLAVRPQSTTRSELFSWPSTA